LLPALAGLEWAIRHKTNLTSTPKNTEFLPSLDGLFCDTRVKPLSQKYFCFPEAKSLLY
jgi:hypothetical protein